MRVRFFIVTLCITLQLAAQPFAKTDVINIYNADMLMNIAKTKGIHELEKIVNPVDLIYLDSNYASTIINLEFKSSFFGKHYENKKVIIYSLPELTMNIAENFNNAMAAKKLFSYYCGIPKFVKSDTIYNIYHNLDDYLKIMVNYPTSSLIKRLKLDDNDWTKLGKKSPKKIYPTIEEIPKTPFEKSIKFKTNDLYVDCNYVALQIASALNYLNVKEFDNSLLKSLKTKQSHPFASRYSFPKPTSFNSKSNSYKGKTIINSTSISNFKKDYKKIERLISGNFEYCCGSKIYKIIEKDLKARVYQSRNNGIDNYLICLRPGNMIKVDLIYSTIE